MKHKLSNGKVITIRAETLYGLWSPSEKTISISENIEGFDFFETVVHEVLHAELDGLKIINAKRRVVGEEDFVTRAAGSIARAFQKMERNMNRQRRKR
jgi:hypothetical protein